MGLLEQSLQYAKDSGFSHYGPLNVKKLKLLEEVRDMCSADRCHAYGRSWVCPPACGTIPEIREKIKGFSSGILVQTTGEMEDDFDVEAMMETEEIHKKHFMQFVEKMRETGEKVMPMAAGTCRICKTCAYPEPCRFPEKAIPSMEACGLFVSKTCEDSGLGYYYGKNTITYTSCVLF